MNYIIIGTVVLIIGVGIISFSGILGSIASIIGLSLMLKGRRSIGNQGEKE